VRFGAVDEGCMSASVSPSMSASRGLTSGASSADMVVEEEMDETAAEGDR
jgi:hypothetical protein